MTLIGELTSYRDGKKTRLKGDSEGARVIALWLNLYVPNYESVSFVKEMFGLPDIQAQKKLENIKASEPNFWCEIKVYKGFVFIVEFDWEGEMDKCALVDLKSFNELLLEYEGALQKGLKNMGSILLEYKGEGREAECIFEELFLP